MTLLSLCSLCVLLPAVAEALLVPQPLVVANGAGRRSRCGSPRCCDFDGGPLVRTSSLARSHTPPCSLTAGLLSRRCPPPACTLAISLTECSHPSRRRRPIGRAFSPPHATSAPRWASSSAQRGSTSPRGSFLSRRAAEGSTSYRRSANG